MIEEQLRDLAFQAIPNEVCGFIMKDGSIIQVPNLHHDPKRGFLMASQCLETLNPYGIQAIWHSHPKGSLKPSKADIESIRVGAIWPEWEYWIVTKDEVVKIDTKSFVPQDDSFWLKYHGASTR